MKKVVILSGAGISAESGISTFRDSGGLWEQYDVMDVASVAGFQEYPGLHVPKPNESAPVLSINGNLYSNGVENSPYVYQP